MGEGFHYSTGARVEQCAQQIHVASSICIFSDGFPRVAQQSLFGVTPLLGPYIHSLVLFCFPINR